MMALKLTITTCILVYKYIELEMISFELHKHSYIYYCKMHLFYLVVSRINEWSADIKLLDCPCNRPNMSNEETV
jgi:hypothetical protein